MALWVFYLELLWLKFSSPLWMDATILLQNLRFLIDLFVGLGQNRFLTALLYCFPDKVASTSCWCPLSWSMSHSMFWNEHGMLKAVVPWYFTWLNEHIWLNILISLTNVRTGDAWIYLFTGFTHVLCLLHPNTHMHKHTQTLIKWENLLWSCFIYHSPEHDHWKMAYIISPIFAFEVASHIGSLFRFVPSHNSPFI